MSTKPTLYAGVLPYAYHNDKIYLLLGREREGGEWSDFGGGREKGESSKTAASREGYEESMGFLASSPAVLKRKLESFIDTGYRGHIYPFEIKYNTSLTTTYNSIVSYMKRCRWRCPEGYLEKDKVKWVRFDNLHSLRLNLRHFFRLSIPRIQSYFGNPTLRRRKGKSVRYR